MISVFVVIILILGLRLLNLIIQDDPHLLPNIAHPRLPFSLPDPLQLELIADNLGDILHHAADRIVHQTKLPEHIFGLLRGSMLADLEVSTAVDLFVGVDHFASYVWIIVYV